MASGRSPEKDNELDDEHEDELEDELEVEHHHQHQHHVESREPTERLLHETQYNAFLLL